MGQDSDPRRVAGRYELISELGRGGMGVVWRGEDLLLRRDVAVKEVKLPHDVAAAEREQARARVLREARAAASLNHPGAVMIFDVVDHGGHTFIVMELLDGLTLVELVESDGPLAPDAVARLGLNVLGALETAHSKGIVHRDVKPANVMVMPDGRAKLSDFGIATLQDDTRITSSGLVLGSPSFMAPEQASGAPSTPESDLWGLGATLYFALEGRPPFERPGVIPTLAAIINESPRPMERAGSLGPLIEGLLAKTPAARPRPEEVRAALSREAAPGPTTAGPARTRPPEAPALPRRPPEQPRARTSVEMTPRRAAASSTPPRKRRAMTAAGFLLAGIALVVAGVVGGRALLTPDAPGRSGDEASVDGGPGRDGGAAGQKPRVPARWSTYPISDTGFTVSYPPHWEEDASGPTQVDLRDPASGSYLRVAWTDSPGPSPVGAWEDLSADFGAHHDDYNEIRIEPTTFKGYDAAVWEYAYTEEGARLHAVDLGFVTGEFGLALNFQTREENWDDSQRLWRRLKASFAGGG